MSQKTNQKKGGAISVGWDYLIEPINRHGSLDESSEEVDLQPLGLPPVGIGWDYFLQARAKDPNNQTSEGKPAPSSMGISWDYFFLNRAKVPLNQPPKKIDPQKPDRPNMGISWDYFFLNRGNVPIEQPPKKKPVPPKQGISWDYFFQNRGNVPIEQPPKKKPVPPKQGISWDYFFQNRGQSAENKPDPPMQGIGWDYYLQQPMNKHPFDKSSEQSQTIRIMSTFTKRPNHFKLSKLGNQKLNVGWNYVYLDPMNKRDPYRTEVPYHLSSEEVAPQIPVTPTLGVDWDYLYIDPMQSRADALSDRSPEEDDPPPNVEFSWGYFDEYYDNNPKG